MSKTKEGIEVKVGQVWEVPPYRWRMTVTEIIRRRAYGTYDNGHTITATFSHIRDERWKLIKDVP